MTEQASKGEASQPTTSALRLLIVTPAVETTKSPSPFPSCLERLTGTKPASDVVTYAGYTSHPPLHLSTKYYNANISIWCDELPRVAPDTLSTKSQDSNNDFEDVSTFTPPSTTSTSLSPQDQQSTLSEWQDQMLSQHAREVRDVVGGIIVLLPFVPQSISSTTVSSQITQWSPYLEGVTALRDVVEEESGRDVASIVLLQAMAGPSATAAISNEQSESDTEKIREQVEDECLSKHGIIGWDYIIWQPRLDNQQDQLSSEPQPKVHEDEDELRNEFGEKKGFPRVIEVLEATDWTANPSSTFDADIDNHTEDLIGADPLDFLDDNNNDSINSLHPNINITRANNQHTQTKDLDLSEVTRGLLTRDHNGLQRELLGMKMAMLDHPNQTSAPSSLAGEFDLGDFGARTPMPAATGKEVAGGGFSTPVATGTPRTSRLVESFRLEDEGEDESEVASGGEGDTAQVEQLSGLMERVVAIREAAGSMNPVEREKFARREVNRIMREMG